MPTSLPAGRTARLLALAVGFTALAACANPHAGGAIAIQDKDTRIDVVFGDQDRRVIHDYYRRHRAKGLPPGLAKRSKLPPGIAKQLARADRLPPDVHGRRLPRELERRLPRLPDGYARVRIGTDIVLLDVGTRVVVDVVHVMGSGPA